MISFGVGCWGDGGEEGRQQGLHFRQGMRSPPVRWLQGDYQFWGVVRGDGGEEGCRRGLGFRQGMGWRPHLSLLRGTFQA